MDNSNGVPQGFSDDVAMAMGWDFHLASDEYAVISFILDETEPGSGFYLTHADQDSSEVIFFSSTLTTITTNPVPEPGTLILFGIGLIAISKFSVSNEKRNYL